MVMNRQRDKRDWIFLAFLAVALVVAAYTVVQRTRYRRAITSLATCAADADTACAGRALEEARAIDGDNLRTRIGQAQLRVLLGDADAAEHSLVETFADPPKGHAPIVHKVGTAPLHIDADGIGSLDAGVRGDLLLVDGDIAAARSQADLARSRWTEAATIVDEALLRPRRDRLDRRAAEGEAQMSASLRRLRDDFEKLFAASEAGQLEGSQLIARDLRDRVQRLTSDTARQKLGLSIDAAQRAMMTARTRKMELDGTSSSMVYGKPEPPPPSVDRSAYAQRSYEQRMAEYQRALDRWTTTQSENDRRKGSRLGELSGTIATVIAQARALFEEGLSAAGATRAPVASVPQP